VLFELLLYPVESVTDRLKLAIDGLEPFAHANTQIDDGF
jgi:hypothetical protein